MWIFFTSSVSMWLWISFQNKKDYQLHVSKIFLLNLMVWCWCVTGTSALFAEPVVKLGQWNFPLTWCCLLCVLKVKLKSWRKTFHCCSHYPNYSMRKWDAKSPSTSCTGGRAFWSCLLQIKPIGLNSARSKGTRYVAGKQLIKKTILYVCKWAWEQVRNVPSVTHIQYSTV